MSSRIVYGSCTSCNSLLIERKLSVKDYVASGEYFEIWECNNCQLRFTQNAPGKQDIGYYYNSEDYLSHSTSTGSFFNKFYQLARKYSVRWRSKKVEKIAGLKSGNLLDIGSGTGAFPAYMKSKGWKVTSLEPDQDSRNAALKLFQIEMRPMDDLQQLPSASFDVITLWHVLEHVHDLKTYIQELHRLLKPNGVALIAMPNYKSFDSNFYKENWDAYDAPRHLFHFSAEAFLQFTSANKFEITEKKTFWLDPYYTCLQSEEHKSGRKNWLTAMFYGSISLLKGIADINEASTITYILKKQNT